MAKNKNKNSGSRSSVDKLVADAREKLELERAKNESMVITTPDDIKVDTDEEATEKYEHVLMQKEKESGLKTVANKKPDVELSTDNTKMFKAKAGTSAKKLGSAIANELYISDKVDVRAIGLQAVNQTVKGISIAGSFLSQRDRGYNIYVRMSFKLVPSTAEEGKLISAMYFECYKEVE